MAIFHQESVSGGCIGKQRALKRVGCSLGILPCIYAVYQLNMQRNPTADRQPGTFPEVSM